MTNVYRIKLIRWDFSKDQQKTKDEYREHCIRENILACGWPSNSNCQTLNEYYSQVNNMFHEKGSVKTNERPYTNHSSWQTAFNIIKEISENGGFCWTQGKGGIYYLGKVTPNTTVRFIEPGYPEIGICMSCDWKEFKLECVPGKVISCLIGGKTLQRIDSDKVSEYSECLYEGKCPSKIDFNQFLHADDLEDLLGLYLQSKGYYVFPSTNKRGTELFEYMLVKKNTGKRAIIQCKIGDEEISDKNIEIFIKKYSDYDVFIATVKDKDYFGQNIETIRMGTLYEFAKNNEDILPLRIKNFLSWSK